jgi:iron complex transport system ATP-binding protein
MLTLEDAGYAAQGRTRLHRTSLAVSPSTVTLIVGRNGSGKSTLLSLMSAGIHPTTGVVRLNNDDASLLSKQTLAQRRAVLGQEQRLAFGFRVREVVSWGRFCWRATPQAREDDRVIDQMMDDQGIAHLALRRVTELSGGERQRVHLARVRAQQAPTLLLDEADASLDLEGRHHLSKAVRAEAERGCAVVMVSHDIHRQLEWVDRVIAVADGRIVIDSPRGSLDLSALSDTLRAPLG